MRLVFPWPARQTTDFYDFVELVRSQDCKAVIARLGEEIATNAPVLLLQSMGCQGRGPLLEGYIELPKGDGHEPTLSKLAAELKPVPVTFHA